VVFRRKNALERAMERAARDPDEFQEDFYARLLEATLHVPAAGPQRDERGAPIHAVFSSAAEARAFDERAPCEEVPAPEAFRRISGGARVVLNPAGDPFYAFDPEEVRALAEGLMPGSAELRPRVLPAGHRLAVAPPEENPVALKQALRAAFEGIPAVQVAYLVQIADEERGRLFLGLELAEADDDEMAEVMEALDPVIQDHLGPDQFLDAAMLNGTSLLGACRDVVPPFYRRG
jgi:hypothetical protein